MDEQIESKVYADGDFIWQNKSIKVHMSAAYKKHTTYPVEVSFWSDEDEAGRIFSSCLDFPQVTIFDGEDVFKRKIYILGIENVQVIGGKKLDAIASFYLEGHNPDIDPEKEMAQFQVVVSRVPILISEWLYGFVFDGTICKEAGEDREGIRWHLQNGTAQLIENFIFQTDDEHKHMTKRLSEHVINLEYSPSSTSEVKAILLQIPKLLKEDLEILSFLCRKRIVCNEVLYRKKGEGVTTYVKFNNWAGFYNYPTDNSTLRGLLNFHDLKDGLFDQLLMNYQSSAYKSIISQALPYIVSSYEDGYMEPHLISAFFSLEGIVNSIGELEQINNILPTSKFDKIAKVLKERIKEYGLTEQEELSIYSKFGELNRRAFTEKLLYLLRKFGVNTNLIWPENINQQEELHNIIKRRNNLIHKGQISNNVTALFDLNRIQKLTELWILKLLECPDDAVNQNSLYRGAQINKIL